MNCALKCDQIAVNRKAVADSWVEEKPVLCAHAHDSIREINPANLIFVPGDWPTTVAVDTNVAAGFRGTPAPHCARSTDKAGRIHERSSCERRAWSTPPERPTTSPFHGQSAARYSTSDGQLVPLADAPLAFNLLFRSFTSCRWLVILSSLALICASLVASCAAWIVRVSVAFWSASLIASTSSASDGAASFPDSGRASRLSSASVAASGMGAFAGGCSCCDNAKRAAFTCNGAASFAFSCWSESEGTAGKAFGVRSNSPSIA